MGTADLSEQPNLTVTVHCQATSTVPSSARPIYHCSHGLIILCRDEAWVAFLARTWISLNKPWTKEPMARLCRRRQVSAAASLRGSVAVCHVFPRRTNNFIFLFLISISFLLKFRINLFKLNFINQFLPKCWLVNPLTVGKTPQKLDNLYAPPPPKKKSILYCPCS